MARYSALQLQRIFDASDGRCHLCFESLSRDGYGIQWEVDHSRARKIGGSSSLRNLYAAHLACNRSKQVKPARTVRAQFGFAKKPLSKQQRAKRASSGAAVGLGGASLLHVEPVAGAVVGWLLGQHDSPRKTKR